MYKSSNYEMQADRIDWPSAYQDQRYLNLIAGNLISFSLEVYNRAYVVQHLIELEDVLIRADSGEVTQAELDEVVFKFMWEKHIDDVRVVSLFENAMKAALLSHGKVVHTFKEVDNAYIRSLKKLQRKCPLDGKVTSDPLVAFYLQPNTLPMAILLSKGYQKVIDLGNEMVDIVTAINSERNRIHFLSQTVYTTSAAIIKRYKTIDKLAKFIASNVQPFGTNDRLRPPAE